ncbi:Ubiquitin-conjugating enzyme [Macleaya cordata]|uniref:Ubiquitin-conjugating enzyme n=1 Tax=Macleaya cordata TaxID=56857 RepID=A0A200R0C7_MACCD|nr:Ubiquitin-conjugating enzyme [Macleaya cordata]
MEDHQEMIEIRVEGGRAEAEADAAPEKEKNEVTVIRREFKQFDIIPTVDDDENNSNTNNSSINDHHYYASSSSSSSNQHQIRNSKKIMKEWKILEQNLPDSIYVRVYEARIDLLRAVIIGAAGTPYHDGLFFFDFQFPSDYPNKPPKVYYHSFGYRLNPNLYDDGKVCLSLLNTWSGTKNEKWNPSESSVLQILLSIQALVLNSKPYFNEPGYGNITTNLDYWNRVSLAYNKDVFVLSCRTMLALLNRPPKHFEEFVGQYFRDRAETILIACKAYIGGRVRVGDSLENSTTTTTTTTTTVASKTKFQNSMGIMYSKLVKAFIKNGSSLENYVGENMAKNQVESHLHETKAGRIVCWVCIFLLVFSVGILIFYH